MKALPDREHIRTVTDVASLRRWLESPNGGHRNGEVLFESVENGTVWVRTKPYTDYGVQYEYAVIRDGDDPNGVDPEDGIHRGPWPEDNCRAWIKEGEDDGFRAGAFRVVRRPIGEWEVIE